MSTIRATVERRFGPTTVRFSVACDSPGRLRRIAGEDARILSWDPAPAAVRDQSHGPPAVARDAA